MCCRVTLRNSDVQISLKLQAIRYWNTSQMTKTQNEIFHVMQLNRYRYCLIVDKVFIICSRTCLRRQRQSSNAPSMMLWSLSRPPFSQLCFSSSMLCIRYRIDSLMDDTPYLAKTRLKFGLFSSHRFGQKRRCSCLRSRTVICARYTWALSTFRPNYRNALSSCEKVSKIG